jgi:hypothetical protein
MIMHSLEMFLLSALKLMVLPGLLVGLAWPWLFRGATGLASLAGSAVLGAAGGVAGALALAGIVATLKIEAWRGAGSVYVGGSVVGAVIMLALVAKLRS